MSDDEEVPQLLEVDDVPDLVETTESEAGPGPSTSRVPQTGVGSDPYARPRIPLTLLTGYLGAGKSTLLEYILTADHGYRIAVCMNDFGDTTDIEAKALTLSDPSTGEQSTSFLSLPNGCLCCSVKDLGIAAIEEMVVNQRDKVDWVMVELTGVADPGPIAKSFWENEEMGDLVLDGIVCVVDSKNIMKQLDELSPSGLTNDAQKQLAASDVILLNKVDLASPSQISQVRSRVQSLNPTLRIHETVKGKMPLGEIFNLRAYSDSETTPPDLQFLKDSQAASTTEDRSSGHDECHDAHEDHDHDHAGHAHSAHLNEISTVLIPLPTLSPAQWERLNLFLETVLWEGKVPVPSKALDSGDQNVGADNSGGKMEVLRTKGLIRLDDGKEMVLQGVMDIFELKEVVTGRRGQSAPGLQTSIREGGVGYMSGGGHNAETSGGKVVFIGKGVERLKPALEAFLGLGQ